MRTTAADSIEQLAGSPVSHVYLSALLDCMAEPVFVIDSDRKVAYKNFAAARILAAKAGVQVRGSRLGFATSRNDEKLLASLLKLHQAPEGTCRGFAISRSAGTRDWLVVVRALKAERKGNMFLVQMIARLRPRTVPVDALRDMFELSDRELDVVTALLASNSPRAVARRMTVGRETVRTHLKRIFRKCNVHSQAELLSLMHCLSVLAARPDA